MATSAMGESAKHRGFRAQAEASKTTAASVTDTHASATLIRPCGISREAVRGFFASRSRSAMRLNPIATNRAAVNAMTTRATWRHDTGAVHEAATAPIRANGSAKTV